VFTEIYDLEAHRTHRHLQNLRLTSALDLQVLEKNQLDTMRMTGGRLFALTAGMMSENTPAHEVAARLAGEERHAIFFVGYADPGTPGGRMKASEPGKSFFFSTQAGEITRRCEMESFDLTAHANREDLFEFIGEVDPHTVVLSHGEDDSRAWFEAQIHAHHPKIRVIQAGPGQSIEVPAQ
jgi:Cft2 family RNA processing exonuclease